MVPTSNKEDGRYHVIRGETAAASGAMSTARAQPMSALPGFNYCQSFFGKEHSLYGQVVLLQTKIPSNTTFTAYVRY